MGKEAGFCCSFCLSLVIIILSTVLMGVSVRDVEYWSAGILINSISKKIDEGVVYLPGK
jgi:hypothetical protein